MLNLVKLMIKLLKQLLTYPHLIRQIALKWLVGVLNPVFKLPKSAIPNHFLYLVSFFFPKF